MPITIITGVPGTGKTAVVVSFLEEQAKAGRVIFSNIAGLKVPHYRLGKVTDWQKGTWLHIDRYKRTSPDRVMASAPAVAPVDDEEVSDIEDANENWEPNPQVFYTDDGVAMVRVRGQDGQVVGVTEYQSHKGALLVIDECQSHFRPRPAGSPVPDHVAALEVHRHQGLDIWLITQRPGLIDSNVRGLCGCHIALRSTALGRYKYEWPEVGDIDSKSSRDTAARTRFKLPKHVFSLYKSAEVHTKHGHSLSFVAKSMFVVVPLFFVLAYMSWSIISSKFHPKAQEVQTGQIHPSASAGSVQFPAGFVPTPQVAMDSIPVIPGRPETAPMYAPLRQVVSIPWPDACITMGERCSCYTEQGSRIEEINSAACMDILKKGRVFNPYRRNNDIQQVAYVPVVQNLEPVK